MPTPRSEQGVRYWKWVGGGARYTPDAKPRYEVVPQGCFGRNALLIRDTQPGAPALMSFPISLEKDQVYTLSFSAKADRPRTINVSLCSAARGGKFVGKNGPWGDTWNPESKFRITPEWNRYSRTFTADAGGVQIGLFGCGGNTLIDGIQIEKGRQPTEFTAAPVDGVFTTSDPDNDLVRGAPLNAGFTFTGKPGTVGRVNVSVKNAFREVLWTGSVDVRIGKEGIGKVGLPIPAETLGEGIFVVRAEYRIGKNAPYFDYYRFSIMTPLKNLHPTRTFSEPSDITTASPAERNSLRNIGTGDSVPQAGDTIISTGDCGRSWRKNTASPTSPILSSIRIGRSGQITASGKPFPPNWKNGLNRSPSRVRNGMIPSSIRSGDSATRRRDPIWSATGCSTSISRRSSPRREASDGPTRMRSSSRPAEPPAIPACADTMRSRDI